MWHKRRLLAEIILVLIFKALFFWGIWACCFRQGQPLQTRAPFLAEVRHGVDR